MSEEIGITIPMPPAEHRPHRVCTLDLFIYRAARMRRNRPLDQLTDAELAIVREAADAARLNSARGGVRRHIAATEVQAVDAEQARRRRVAGWADAEVRMVPPTEVIVRIAGPDADNVIELVTTDLDPRGSADDNDARTP